MVRPFNILHSFVTKAWVCPRLKWDFNGARKEIWPDALPDATNDTAKLKPRFAGVKVLHLNHQAVAAASRNDKNKINQQSKNTSYNITKCVQNHGISPHHMFYYKM